MASRAKNIDGTIAYRIKRLRLSKGMTQLELAKKVYKSESTVRMWELGKSEPDLATVNILADIFGCTTDYLIDGTKTNPLPEAIVDLSDGERMLLEMFRDASPYQQELILRLLSAEITPKG